MNIKDDTLNWLNAEIDEIVDSSFEDDFQKMRDEMYEWQHYTFQNFFSQWCAECGVKVVAYNHTYPESNHNGTLTIYTTQPGYMIGSNGSLVNKYKEMFEKIFNGKYDIKFEEIHGDFIIVKESIK